LAEFDRYAHPDAYRREVERSIAFSGVGAELFVATKARLAVDLAARHLGDPVALAALDVGCGVGETDRYLKGQFGLLAGVDISAESVARAAERNPWATYHHSGEGAPLPFDDAHFDFAFTICVLHHVPPRDRPSLLTEMCRVVRPGGLVAMFEHNPYNPLTRLAVSNCEFDADAVLLSRHHLRRLLSKTELEPLESRYIFFFPREGELLRAAERRLGWLPLGAQYYVASRRG
jgi:SAM-dependent methyltransferase